jgi:hypothetical protein
MKTASNNKNNTKTASNNNNTKITRPDYLTKDLDQAINVLANVDGYLHRPPAIQTLQAFRGALERVRHVATQIDRERQRLTGKVEEMRLIVEKLAETTAPLVEAVVSDGAALKQTG